MSALGEYVHLNWSNYLKYGITRSSKNGKTGYGAVYRIFNAQKKAIRSKVGIGNNKGTQNLESRLNSLIYPQGSNSQSIDNELYSKLQQLSGGLLVAWGGRIDLSAGTSANKVSTSQRFSLTNLQQKKKEAEQVIKQITSNPAKNVKRYEQLTIQLQALIDEIGRVEATALSNVQRISTDKSGVQWVKYYSNDKIRKHMIPTINNILSNIATTSRALATGTLFENAIGVLDDRINNSVAQTSDEIINKIFVGSKTVNVKPITKAAVYQKNLRTSLGQVADGDFKVDLGYTEGDMMKTVSKVDINLQYQDELYKITAKNYNLKEHKNLHLVSNTGLLDVLMKNVNSTFINHYLNIVTTGTDTWQSIAHQAAKSIIAIEAITGLSQEGGGAEYLVVNNRSAKKVRVIPINQILNSTQWETFFSFAGYDNGVKIAAAANVRSGGDDVPNDFLEGKKRVDNLLTAFHKVKISASLNSAGLNRFGI